MFLFQSIGFFAEFIHIPIQNTSGAVNAQICGFELLCHLFNNFMGPAFTVPVFKTENNTLDVFAYQLGYNVP